MPCWNLPDPDWWKWDFLQLIFLPGKVPHRTASSITLRGCVIGIGEATSPELISSVLKAVRHA